VVLCYTAKKSGMCMDEIKDIEQWLEENWNALGSKMDYILYDLSNQYCLSDIYVDLKKTKVTVSCKSNGEHIKAMEYNVDSIEIKDAIDNMRKGASEFIYIPTIIQYNGSFRTQYMDNLIILRVVPNQSASFKIELSQYIIEKIKFKNHLETKLSHIKEDEDKENVIKI
jgi:hypothetical protein